MKSSNRLIVSILLVMIVPSLSFADIGDTAFYRGLEKLAHNKAIGRNQSPVQSFFIFDDNSIRGSQKRTVYWAEARLLLRMPSYDFDDPSWIGIIQLVRILDLEKDLVKEPREIGTSMYLEVEGDVAATIKKCLSGQRITIHRATAK